MPAHTPQTHQHHTLITGASLGLGRAFAEECARRGMYLALIALPGEGLPELSKSLADQYGVQVEHLEIDLTQTESCAVVADWVREKHMPISFLINNAGISYNSRFEDSTLAENETCILLNNLALVKLTHLLLPELKQHPQAYLLNVSSLSAFFPMPYVPVYAPTKAFILNFSLALRMEMQGGPLHVSVLCPNGIYTHQKSRERIKVGGFLGKITSYEPEVVARYALQKTLNGQAIIIPGALNQLIAGISKIAPHALVNRVVSGIWGKTARRQKSA